MTASGDTIGPVPGAGLDPESVAWLSGLRASGADGHAAQARLHALLLRVARAELHRRSPATITGTERDDLAFQAAADAMVAITAKLDRFRGESRFTTWAYRFVILEVSSKIGRHFWQRPSVPLDTEDWDRLPDRFGLDPERTGESRELLAAIRRVVETGLTERQREVFLALVVTGIPLDALVQRTGTSRGALYKTMFDARRKIRAYLVANGHLHDDERGRA